MAVCIDDIVRVKMAGTKPINLTSDLFWKVPCDNLSGKFVTFVKLVKYKSQICRLLGQPMKSRGKDKRKLQFCSIIEISRPVKPDSVLNRGRNLSLMYSRWSTYAISVDMSSSFGLSGDLLVLEEEEGGERIGEASTLSLSEAQHDFQRAVPTSGFIIE